MLRYTLRRLLWSAPGLLFATLLLFWVISLAKPLDKTSWQDDTSGESHRTRFINLAPRDVRTLSTKAIEAARTEPSLASARAQFSYLGGACLPFVLSQLDALDPKTRASVAMALRPVAERMGLKTSNAFSSRETAVVFWTRFWEERDADFQPTVVRRAVRRLAHHDSPTRRTVLVELDTFALASIFEELGKLETPEDVSRIARLLEVASHATNRPACVQEGMPVEQARKCVVQWEDWWISHNTDFQLLSGTQRVSSILTETEYGKWAMQAITLELGVSPDGVTVLHRLKTYAPRSIGLAFLGLLVAYSLAFIIGSVRAFYRKGAIDILTGVGVGALLALPCPLIAVWFARAVHGSWTSVWAMIATVMTVAAALIAMPSRQQRHAAIAETNFDVVTYARAKGLHPVRIMLVHGGKLAAPMAIATMAVDFPLAMSVVCVAEQALGLDGIGPYFVQAVRSHDVGLLMALALVCIAVHIILFVAGEITTSALDSRISRFSHQEHPWL